MRGIVDYPEWIQLARDTFSTLVSSCYIENCAACASIEYQVKCSLYVCCLRYL